MKRSFALVAAFAVLVAVASANAGVQSSVPPQVLSLPQVGELYGEFPIDAPPAGQTPEERAAWLLGERKTLGRTPNEWLKWSHEELALKLPKFVTTASGSALTIATSVASLYENVNLTAPDLASLIREANRVPAPVRAPFAELVQNVATIYALQAPLGHAIAARMPNGRFDPHVPVLSTVERDLMASRQAEIVRAVNIFRARTQTYFAARAVSVPSVKAGGTDPALFQDPEGLVILGGLGNATYTRGGTIKDPILLVEPDGSDLYQTTAGGACPATVNISGTWMECNQLVLSVLADLGDDGDVYSFSGAPSAVQGAGGPGGIGVLIDVAGNDHYYAKMTRGISNFFLTYYFDGGAQGFGYAGNGALIDGTGDDKWEFEVASSAGRPIWALGQGFGGAGGLGIASDVSGNDQWITRGLGGTNFQGIYTQGVGFYAGLGISTDTGLGKDLWFGTVTSTGVDYYAQGFGAFAGAGFMYDDGGDDAYYSYEKATGTSPALDPLLNCAFGTASFGGVGIAVDVLGNDTYYGESASVYTGVEVMDNGFGGPGPAYGLFVDTGGNDRYEMVTTAPAGKLKMAIGRGLTKDGMNTFGTFVDIGGTDTYIPASAGGANNSQWTFGVDRSA